MAASIECRLMRTFRTLGAVSLVCLFHAAFVQAQAGAGPAPANAPVGATGAVLPRPASLPAVDASSVVAGPAVSVPSPATPAIDAKSAVQAVLTMFTINSAVNVEATGKPVPASGSWGAQTQFPAGLPKACVQARVPCIRVIYRVPEINVVCEWTLGMVVVAEPQADGSIRHAVRSLVLDENEAAARYTLRKAWAKDDVKPNLLKLQNPDYPKIAQDAHVGGVVMVRMVVGPDGSVQSAVPLQGPAMLQSSVVAAVRQWKFEPLRVGEQITSFQLDRSFTYDVGRTSISAGMDVHGGVAGQINDPHEGPGTHTDSASGGTWQTCNAATGCTSVAPTVPK